MALVDTGPKSLPSLKGSAVGIVIPYKGYIEANLTIPG